MKVLLKLFTVFLILSLFILSKEECSAGEIGISSSSCESIDNILEKKELELGAINLIYLANTNEGKIEKDNYKLEILNLYKFKILNIAKSNYIETFIN